MDKAVFDIGATLDVFAGVMWLLLNIGIMTSTKQNIALDGCIGIAGIGCNLLGALGSII